MVVGDVERGAGDEVEAILRAQAAVGVEHDDGGAGGCGTNRDYSRAGDGAGDGIGVDVESAVVEDGACAVVAP